MTLTLVQLHTFMRVAEVGNFSRAAEELHLTQPAVTQQVRALERHFGVQLVDVVGRRPVLTDAGRFLVGRARGILKNVAVLERDMGEFAEARLGELRIGATLTIGAYTLPGLLARFQTTHPLIVVHVQIVNTAVTAAHVHDGSVSLGLIEGPLEDDTLTIIPYRSDRLVVVVPPSHPLAHRGAVSSHELSNLPFVEREVGSGTRALAEQALAKVGIRPRIVLELPSGEGVARAVEAGLGISILSWLVVENAVADRRLVALDLTDVDLRRTFRLIYLRSRTLSPAAQAFADMVTSDSVALEPHERATSGGAQTVRASQRP